MQIEIKRLQRQFALTAILVTHDQEEAMAIADRIAVMNKCRIEQLGNPVEIHDKPATLFVNDFIGSSNRFAEEVLGHEGARTVVRLGRLTCAQWGPKRPGRQVRRMCRPTLPTTRCLRFWL
jgi:putative spermidine/putrescine transport system ATP-binding protein